MFAAVLGLSACASAAPQPAPNDDASTVEKAPAPEAKTDDDKGDEGFNKFGGSEGTRTPDPLHAMQVRYQLRHRPVLRSG